MFVFESRDRDQEGSGVPERDFSRRTQIDALHLASAVDLGDGLDLLLNHDDQVAGALRDARCAGAAPEVGAASSNLRWPTAAPHSIGLLWRTR